MTRPSRPGTPFPIAGPVPPDLLIDRVSELQLLSRRAADRVSVRLVAPRRFGKTSVLLAHAAQLRLVGWRTTHVDLSGVVDLTDVARRLTAAYSGLDPEWMRLQLGGLLRRLGVTLSTTGLGVTLNPRPAAVDTPSAEAALEQLLDLPLRLFERDGTSTLVVFDEFQELMVARRNLDATLRAHIQYHGDAAAYVFAGSEPSMMRELFDLRERPFFGQALPLELGRLPVEDALGELAKRFAEEDLETGEALGELVAFADGHPQRTMLLAHLLADMVSTGTTPTPAAADAVIDAAVRWTEPGHEALWQELGATERVVLAAAADGVAPTSRALAEGHRLSRTALDGAANRLVDQGHLIRLDRGAVVVDPLLAEWLRRR